MVDQSLPGDSRDDEQVFKGDLPQNFPGTRVPSQYAEHPLIESCYFFTLPTELLEDVVETVGESRFDGELLKLDRDLAAECGDHSEVIGFRAGVPIQYGLLGRSLSPHAVAWNLDDDVKAALGWKPEHFSALGALTDRTDRPRDTCRAYAGWLSLNPTFLGEQAAFVSRWAQMIRMAGLDGTTPRKREVIADYLADYRSFTIARDEFLARWQLTGLAGPHLPTPPMPHVPLAGGVRTVLPNPDLGTTLFLPTIHPLPERQELLRMIDDVMRRHRLPEHLKEWAELIATDNPGRAKAFPRFQRIFLLQHYWRVLFSRHANALDRQLGKLHGVFANFLIHDADAAKDASRIIKEDLIEIGKSRGGPDWYLHPTPLEGVAMPPR